MFTLPRCGELRKAPRRHMEWWCILLRSCIWRSRRPCIYLFLTADLLIFFIVAYLLAVSIRSHRINSRVISLESPFLWLCYEPSLAIPRLLQEEQSIMTSSTIVRRRPLALYLYRCTGARINWIQLWYMCSAEISLRIFGRIISYAESGVDFELITLGSYYSA